jgi:hypothetical protein
MAGLTAQQICALARQVAKAPGYVSQSGQLLNMILADLCQTYNLEITRKTHYFTFDPGIVAPEGMSIYGSGPYDLPSDFLRMEDDESAIFNIGDGVPRLLIPCDLTQFDMLVQQAGNQSYPCILAIDMSPVDAVQQGTDPGVPQGYVWPPPSGQYAAQFRYFCQMPDIDTPETSTTVPWFPNQSYLQTRLAGELMRITDDDRMPTFLGDGDEGAQGILTRYLKLKDNRNNRAQSVRLDRRSFGGSNFANLPNTKTLGW